MQLLEAEPELSNSELARRAGVSRQTMWQTVKGLEDAGMTTRPKSKYARPTMLSGEGRRHLDTARQMIAAADAVVTIHLTQREAMRLKHLLTLLTSCTDQANNDDDSQPPMEDSSRKTLKANIFPSISGSEGE